MHIKVNTPAEAHAWSQIEQNRREVHPVREITNWRGLTSTEREVLIAIRRGMRVKSTMTASKGWRWTTDDELARDTNLSAKTVRRTLNELIAKNVVEQHRPNKPAPGTRTGYAIHKQACCFTAKST